VFLHALVFFTAAYYTPVYFQVLGSSATLAGIKVMPLSLGSSLTAIVSGLIVVKTGGYRLVMWIGLAIMTLGFGLLIMLDYNTSVAKQEIWLLICGLGIGCIFQPPLIALQASMPLSLMATSTATFGLMRTIGGTIGISVGDAIFSSELTRRLPKIQGFDASTGAGLTNNIQGLSHIQPVALRNEVLHAYSRSLSLIWLVCAPLSFAALIAALPIKKYTLQRNVVRGTKEVPEIDANAEPKPVNVPTDLEKEPVAPTEQ